MPTFIIPQQRKQEQVVPQELVRLLVEILSQFLMVKVMHLVVSQLLSNVKGYQQIVGVVTGTTYVMYFNGEVSISGNLTNGNWDIMRMYSVSVMWITF